MADKEKVTGAGARAQREVGGWIGPIVLVSSSPRRQELLRQIGVPFRVVEPAVDESADGLSPEEHARVIARRKLAAYLSVAPSLDEWALAADTIVVLGTRIIGKPKDREEAQIILRELAGREHSVITALALFNAWTGGVTSGIASTAVTFAPLGSAEIERYLESREWIGVAGGYRIQERGALLVESIRGSYTNVVGLPIRTFYGMVAAQGYSLLP